MHGGILVFQLLSFSIVTRLTRHASNIENTTWESDYVEYHLYWRRSFGRKGPTKHRFDACPISDKSGVVSRVWELSLTILAYNNIISHTGFGFYPPLSAISHAFSIQHARCSRCQAKNCVCWLSLLILAVSWTIIVTFSLLSIAVTSRLCMPPLCVIIDIFMSSKPRSLYRTAVALLRNDRSHCR